MISDSTSSLRIDPDRCIGCRACQIACSFHHRGAFNPKMASLDIRIREGDPQIRILLRTGSSRPASGKGLPCDGCQGEPVPLCVKYCPRGTIRQEKEGVHGHD